MLTNAIQNYLDNFFDAGEYMSIQPAPQEYKYDLKHYVLDNNKKGFR